jgi:excisionase family DNA binding protein
MSRITVQIPLRLLYPIEEGAALLGISKHTLIRDIRRGLVKTTRYGKRVLIPKVELFRLAAEGVQPEAKPERGTSPTLEER